MPDDPISASVNIATSSLGGSLREILDADELRPGDDVSYQICKAMYVSHPLGSKMAETPIRLAQSQDREIACPAGPEEELVEAFNKQWRELTATDQILNVMTQARIYGATTIGMGEQKTDAKEPVSLENLWKAEPFFNTFDPLNTAGSLVTSQDPNSPLFQKWGDITVNGQRYHRSRTITMLNEKSLYLAWSGSAFGYVGRSVYQRAFFPMKSFLWTMIADEMVARKAAVIVARLESPGSIIDRVMSAVAGFKRNILRQARNENVISIGKDEMLETLNMRNVNDALGGSRENIIKNIATAADMPAKMLTQESFVEGFGEGTQDAYAVAQYVDRQRIEMQPIYAWYDTICMYRAWSPDFYEGIRRKYAQEYGDVDYKTAFVRWRNSFKANWPSLIKEKPSEAVEIEDVKLKALIATLQVMAPMVPDAGNKARLLQWFCDQINGNEKLFAGTDLDLDFNEIRDSMMEQEESRRKLQAEESDRPAQPFSSRDRQGPIDIGKYLASRPDLRRRIAQAAASA